MRKKKRETVIDRLTRLIRSLRAMTRRQLITAREAERILRNAVDDAFKRGTGHAD